jgi:hypothetical protein
VSILLGFGGAILGRQLAWSLVLPDVLYVRSGEHRFPVFWAIIAAILVTAAGGWLQGRRARCRRSEA